MQLELEVDAGSPSDRSAVPTEGSAISNQIRELAVKTEECGGCVGEYEVNVQRDGSALGESGQVRRPFRLTANVRLPALHSRLLSALVGDHDIGFRSSIRTGSVSRSLS